MFVLDDAGNETQISPHAMDAPAWLYDPEDPFPHVIREINHYLGVVRYTNLSRQSNLLQRLLLGEDLAELGPNVKTITYTESFPDHNARLKLLPSAELVVRSWPKAPIDSTPQGTNVVRRIAPKAIPQWLKDRGVSSQ